MRVPTRLHFPFGYTIKVKQATKREVAEEIGDGALAGWISDDRTIYLTRSRTPRQKRSDLAHEMSHAVVDYVDWLLTTGLGKL